jgi:hypothetical protein
VEYKKDKRASTYNISDTPWVFLSSKHACIGVSILASAKLANCYSWALGSKGAKCSDLGKRGEVPELGFSSKREKSSWEAKWKMGSKRSDLSRSGVVGRAAPLTQMTDKIWREMYPEKSIGSWGKTDFNWVGKFYTDLGRKSETVKLESVSNLNPCSWLKG